ncbi:MAG: sugar ABC transporter ATP-binding protein, partial [Clostridiales Family XIII bacterium]|nr:sugar ABC transporter ATP-binding protein [Clostridiales Family XIII bacterium]
MRWLGMAHSLVFSDISKSFPGVKALDGVSFRADGGKVLALLGENGAGKSTLLKIMAGDLRADAGTITLDGAVCDYSTPHAAIRAGMSVIYQERQVIPAMSVMENIFAGGLPKGRLGLIDYARLRREAQEAIDQFELPIDARTPVGRLPVAYQQMVEIVKAYRRDTPVIAFDEPTASLADAEISILFRLIGQMKEQGKVILYVSHRLAEIFQIADDVVVLKDGRKTGCFPIGQVDEPDLIRAMVGRDIGDTYAGLQRSEDYGETLLEVEGLVTDKVHDVSFTLRKGEVIGFAGLVGAGRTELVRA